MKFFWYDGGEDKEWICDEISLAKAELDKGEFLNWVLFIKGKQFCYKVAARKRKWMGQNKTSLPFSLCLQCSLIE